MIVDQCNWRNFQSVLVGKTSFSNLCGILTDKVKRFNVRCIQIQQASNRSFRMDKQLQTELEAATFRRLLEHLQQHVEVQNIDLMILADFCRNCLAKWYVASGKEKGVEVDYEQARDIIYGMPYHEWKEKFQVEASPEQMAAYEQKIQLKKEQEYKSNA